MSRQRARRRPTAQDRTGPIPAALVAPAAGDAQVTAQRPSQPDGPGAGRLAAGSLVLGPARREELAEVVGCYPGQWVIVGPCAGDRWFALPRQVMIQPRPDAATLAGLARLQAITPAPGRVPSASTVVPTKKRVP